MASGWIYAVVGVVGAVALTTYWKGRSGGQGKSEVRRDQQRFDKEISTMQDLVEKQIEALNHERKAVEGSKKRQEQAIKYNSKLAQAEKVIEQAESEAEQTEKAEEHEEKGTVKDVEEGIEATEGSKPTSDEKTENKDAEKATKKEIEGEEGTEKTDEKIEEESQDLMAALGGEEEIVGATDASVTMEGHQEQMEIRFASHMHDLVKRLEGWKNFNQINEAVVKWMETEFLPDLFKEMEFKLKLEMYEKIVEDKLLSRLTTSVNLSSKAIDRLPGHEKKLEKLVHVEFKEKQKAIDLLEDFIKHKNKELAKLKKKAKKEKEPQIADNVQKQVNVLESLKHKLEELNSNIDDTSKVLDKSLKRSRNVMSSLKRNEEFVLKARNELIHTHEEVDKKIKSVREAVEESKTAILKIYQQNVSVEEIAVDTMPGIRKFFTHFDEVLEYLITFGEELKKTVTISINMAYNERALFYLIEAMQKAQNAVIKGSSAVVNLTKVIIQAGPKVVTDYDHLIKQMNVAGDRLGNLEKMTEKLESYAKWVGDRGNAALRKIDAEVKQLVKIRQDAHGEEGEVVEAIRTVVNHVTKKKEEIRAQMKPVDTMAQQVQKGNVQVGKQEAKAANTKQISV